jgi:hypothetical protein
LIAGGSRFLFCYGLMTDGRSRLLGPGFRILIAFDSPRNQAFEWKCPVMAEFLPENSIKGFLCFSAKSLGKRA